MAAKLSAGRSTHRDETDAAREAVGAALCGAPDAAFAFVFSTDHYDPDALAAALDAALGAVPWAGCCAAGVFTADEVLTEGLVVGIVSSRVLRFGVGAAGPVSGDGRAAGRQAVARAIAALPPGAEGAHRAAVLMPDGLSGNAADVVRGAVAEGGAALAWAGGCSGDNLRFVRTAQYAGGRALHDHAVAVVIDGPAPFATGMGHGWQPYGPPTLVTGAIGSTLRELDYEPAFDVYRRTVELHGDAVGALDFARFAMSHPLGIPQADGEHVIRDPIAVGARGELACVAEVPNGSLVRIMQGDREALTAAARRAAADAREAARAPLGGAVVFDCVSRALLLGDAIPEELAAIREGLGGDVPVVGCYTYGEVGAMGRGTPQLHNKTAVLLGFPAP